MANFGISKDTRGANALKFKVDPEINNGLALGYLKDVTIGTASFKENQKGNFSDFAGKEVPTLNFHFEGLSTEANGSAPIHIHSYKPVPHILGKDTFGWFYDSMFGMIKHFIDVMSDDQFLDAYGDLLTLAIDFEKEMTFEELMEVYNKFFNGVITVFKGDGKKVPNLLLANDKPILLWIKLLLYVTNDKGTHEVNNGSLGFPNYPGEGVIEKYVEGVSSSLEIAIQKGESIIPRERTSKAPAAPAPSGNGAPSAPGAAKTAGGSHKPPFMQ